MTAWWGWFVVVPLAIVGLWLTYVSYLDKPLGWPVQAVVLSMFWLPLLFAIIGEFS